MFWRFRIENENWFKRVGHWSALFGSARIAVGCFSNGRLTNGVVVYGDFEHPLSYACYKPHFFSNSYPYSVFIFNSKSFFYLLPFIISKQAHLNHLINFRFYTDKYFMIRWWSSYYNVLIWNYLILLIKRDTINVSLFYFIFI